MNDDFVGLTEQDYCGGVDHLVLVDVSDILEQMHNTILSYGEKPAYENLNYGSISAFLFDLYDAVGYVPSAIHHVASNIRDVLDASPQYFDCAELSPLQRECWYVAVQQIIERFIQFKMYDRTHIHRFDFYDYQNGTLYLRRP